ncbi:hypothetical protein [Tolypothrix sp. VBCCA 56010]|uniref:hypothetical protein n=1 Tax=Tolypothrix sp. VBCCA 56010 TaxID=3137731 RepID=UPI003D7E1D0E
MTLITENEASGIGHRASGIERDLALFSIPNFQSSIFNSQFPLPNAHCPVNN